MQEMRARAREFAGRERVARWVRKKQKKKRVLRRPVGLLASLSSPTTRKKPTRFCPKKTMLDDPDADAGLPPDAPLPDVDAASLVRKDKG